MIQAVVDAIKQRKNSQPKVPPDECVVIVLGVIATNSLYYIPPKVIQRYGINPYPRPFTPQLTEKRALRRIDELAEKRKLTVSNISFVRRCSVQVSRTHEVLAHVVFGVVQQLPSDILTGVPTQEVEALSRDAAIRFVNHVHSVNT